MSDRHRTFTTAFLLVLLQAGSSLVAAEQAAPQPPYAAHRPVFLLLGDSLTEFGYGYHWKYKTPEKGWVALLSEAYSRKADVINRGLSGYNSRWALQLLPQALSDLGCSQQQQPRSAFFGWRVQPQQQRQAARCNVQLMVLWFGANDLVDQGGSDGRLHVPLSEYKKNLAAMVTEAKRAGVQQIVLVTPPPVDEQKWAAERDMKASDRKNAEAALYAAGAREVAAQLAVPVLDIYKAFTQQGPQALKDLMNDGVHFAPQGQQLVFNSLKELIESNAALSAVRSGELPNHYPLFNQVDESNPSKTFKELFDRQVVVPPSSKKTGPTEKKLE